MPAPVSDKKLTSVIKDFLTKEHAVAAGPFGPIVAAFIKAILPALIAFLQSQFDITPKSPPA